MCSILAGSLSSGNEAVEAIVDYRSVERLLANASAIAQSANHTLRNVVQLLNTLMGDELEEEILELNTTLEYLFMEWAGLSSTLQC